MSIVLRFIIAQLMSCYWISHFYSSKIGRGPGDDAFICIRWPVTTGVDYNFLLVFSIVRITNGGNMAQNISSMIKNFKCII